MGCDQRCFGEEYPHGYGMFLANHSSRRAVSPHQMNHRSLRFRVWRRRFITKRGLARHASRLKALFCEFFGKAVPRVVHCTLEQQTVRLGWPQGSWCRRQYRSHVGRKSRHGRAAFHTPAVYAVGPPGSPAFGYPAFLPNAGQDHRE
jgi:hypothetical protein